ncbi:hypothetical protein [Nocardia vinacea]|uniref:hypothetical protein n=1 Tax=Nocardia vinacea TaxID=96468 RepID=UPI0002F5012C|nr:hypothetical protein [Nocardia vinacea]
MTGCIAPWNARSGSRAPDRGCGAPAPDFDTAWLAYRQQALYPYFIWLSTIGHSAVAPKYQPDEVCLGIIERTANAVLDLDATRAVESAG